MLLDEHIVECVKETGTQEEFESRVLSGIRTLFINDMLPEDSEMFFVYELLESLLRYEKDEEDFLKIKNAVNHPLNPLHIGKCFYEKLIYAQEGSV